MCINVCVKVDSTIVRENVCNRAKNVKTRVFFLDFEKRKKVTVMICKDLETTQSVFVL